MIIDINEDPWEEDDEEIAGELITADSIEFESKYDEDNLPPHIQQMLSGKFDVNKPPKELLNPILTHNFSPGQTRDSDLAGRGDIVVIGGGDGAGKTALMGAIMSSAFTSKLKYTFGFKLNLNPGNMMIHIDTEQGGRSYYNYNKRLAKTSGYEQGNLPNFLSYPLASLDFDQRVDAIEYLVLKHSKKLDVLVIDGALDLVVNMNDTDSCALLLQRMLDWKEIADCTIIIMMHMPKGMQDSEILIGTLGSFLSRKATTIMGVYHIAEAGMKKVKLIKDRIGDKLPTIEFYFDKKEKVPILNKIT